MKAVIPAAGLGTRFLPATKALPKEMLPIVDKPIIQFVVEEAVQANFKDILMVTGRNKNALENHFDRAVELENRLIEKGSTASLDRVFEPTNLANIHYIRQKNPSGLGHAVLCAKTFVGNEKFALLLGDEIIHKNSPMLEKMSEISELYGAHVVALMEVPSSETYKYGIASIGQNIGNDIYSLEALVEKPPAAEAPSNLAIIGRYILLPTVFEILENTSPGVNNEIQLTDALNQIAKPENQETILGVVFKGRRFDAGDKQGYLQANIELAMEHDELSNTFMDWLVEFIGDYRLKKEIHQSGGIS